MGGALRRRAQSNSLRKPLKAALRRVIREARSVVSVCPALMSLLQLANEIEDLPGGRKRFRAIARRHGKEQQQGRNGCALHGTVFLQTVGEQWPPSVTFVIIW